MKATFFLYEKDSGLVIYFNALPPENADYIRTGFTIHADRRASIENANWKKIGIWANEDGIEVDEEQDYLYNEISNTLTASNITTVIPNNTYENIRTNIDLLKDRLRPLIGMKFMDLTDKDKNWLFAYMMYQQGYLDDEGRLKNK